MQDDLILGPKMDPRNYETVKCEHCGSITFSVKYIFKKVSGIEMGNGSEPRNIPLSIFVCDKCGKILSDDIKLYGLEKDLGLDTENKEEKTSENKTGLIL